MAFTPEQFQAIIQSLTGKIGGDRACPMCGHNTWTVNDGLVLLTLQPPTPGAVMLGGITLPNVTITCKTCGNTVLFNVFTLGLAEMFGIMPTEGSK